MTVLYLLFMMSYAQFWKINYSMGQFDNFYQFAHARNFDDPKNTCVFNKNEPSLSKHS